MNRVIVAEMLSEVGKHCSLPGCNRQADFRLILNGQTPVHYACARDLGVGVISMFVAAGFIAEKGKQ